MAGTATWTTTEIPAYLLEPGDRTSLYGPAGRPAGVDTTTVVRCDVDHDVVTLLLDTGVTLEGDARQMVTVHVPDEPVDGYGLWKSKPDTFPSGCTCVYRRNPDWAGNWDLVTTDPDCHSHGVHDNWED